MNKYYEALPEIVQKYMDKVAKLTGRTYRLFDYVGAPDATDVVVIMGSGADTMEWASDYINERGGKTGVLKVRLYRPFSAKHFVQALPASVKRVAVLDRTKEPGSLGEPFCWTSSPPSTRWIGSESRSSAAATVLPARTSLRPMRRRSSTTSRMAFGNFTVGINDDVTNRSIKIKERINVIRRMSYPCMFWGLGSDGTVGANKNSIKIIGDNTDLNAQAYFSYDSKKSGGITIDHLRFGRARLKCRGWLTTPISSLVTILRISATICFRRARRVGIPLEQPDSIR